jgi:hypothetical protein
VLCHPCSDKTAARWSTIVGEATSPKIRMAPRGFFPTGHSCYFSFDFTDQDHVIVQTACAVVFGFRYMQAMLFAITGLLTRLSNALREKYLIETPCSYFLLWAGLRIVNVARSP